MFNYREDVGSPTQVCKDCALKHGGRLIEGHISSMWLDRCDVCGCEGKPVTHPRDYGYPSFPVSSSSRNINDLRQDISQFVKRCKVDI